MSKGILNNRDKFVWDNTHKPDISDVVAEVDDEMDDLLDDHDDKVVSIVGDNMSTLLSSNAAAIRLIAGDKSGITSTPVKIGTWDAGNDLYAVRVTGTFEETTSTIYLTLVASVVQPVSISGYIKNVSDVYAVPATGSSAIVTTGTRTVLSVPASYSLGTYDLIFYYLVSIATP